MDAWERSDAVAFERALRAAATLEGAPSRTWFSRQQTCVAFAAPFLEEFGAWRMMVTSANGQPAAVSWFHGEPFAPPS